MDRYEVTLASKVQSVRTAALEAADSFVSRNSLAKLDSCEVLMPTENAMSLFPMELFRLKRLAYNPSEGIVDKLVNVYASMNSIGATIFTLIHGTQEGCTEFFIGCVSRKSGDASSQLLKNSFEGNFPGIEFSSVTGAEKKTLMDSYFPLEYKHQSIASVSVSADFRKNKAEEQIQYIQGVEKFINTMKGQEYSALFLAEPISRSDCRDKKLAYENIITELSKFSHISINYSENDSLAVNEALSSGTSDSIAKSINNSVSDNTSYSIGVSKGRNSGSTYSFFGTNHNSGKSSSKSETNTSGRTTTDGTSETQTYGKNESTTRGTTKTTGSSTGMTINVESKTVTDIIAKLEYELKKLENADSFGMWDTAIYIISGDANTTIIAANSIRSLVLGDESGKAESFINYWDNTARSFTYGSTGKVMQFIHHGMHPVFRRSDNDKYYFTPAIAVGGNVLPSVIGLPMNSVPGVTVIESAEFGRNIVTDDSSLPGNRSIRLGEIMYMGKKDYTEVNLFVNSLSLHTFICGAPGSGKSNTVYKLMYELCRLSTKPERDGDYGNVKFLVIEPAKGEYKYEFGKMPNINIFTTKSGLCEMLCINPFEFPHEKMDVREHIERLKNILSACWPLTAAMPSILSAAIERAFVRCGWDIENSLFVYPGDVRYPSFSDVLKSLSFIIDNSKYSEQAKGDYKGALLTRVESLTRGIVGSVFTSVGTVSDERLFDRNTIIDLSMVGSPEARSLIMGILVMKLENYRKATATQANYPLRHVTILEEAHNLLPRCSTAQSDDSSNVQGKSVEAISNAISEMRTFGEGFIIIDQSPSAVASVAVSNTSTKIIMRLPSEEDVRAAGSSIGLSEEQMKHIPMLPQGQAIVKQDNWIAPVMLLVDRASSSYNTRKLKTYEYDDLKVFRAELIEKLFQVVERNKGRENFASTDIKSIVKFIERQTDIAPDVLAKYNAYWLEFCKCNITQRTAEINRLIVKMLSFEQAISMALPTLGLEEYGREEIMEWTESLENVLKAYVVADDEALYKIMSAVIKYCAAYSEYKSVRKCAAATMELHSLR